MKIGLDIGYQISELIISKVGFGFMNIYSVFLIENGECRIENKKSVLHFPFSIMAIINHVLPSNFRWIKV